MQSDHLIDIDNARARRIAGTFAAAILGMIACGFAPSQAGAAGWCFHNGFSRTAPDGHPRPFVQPRLTREPPQMMSIRIGSLAAAAVLAAVLGGAVAFFTVGTIGAVLAVVGIVALAAFGTRWFLLPNQMYGSWERNRPR